ncbi:MAG: FtsX-like permease family protein [Chitinivibrionales bacterium]|nr:FtsX-like permease family protein [Chitinivibrionales bacterium]MBD3394271.1 FtsX-like permease family protein [Chitinivibrionales bacterium]
MLYILKMAFRNISRNRRRSILAFTSVALAIAFVTFFRGFAGGLIRSIVKNYTKNETGHIRITTNAFADKSRFNPVTENIDDPERIVDAIRSDAEIGPEVNLVTERITFGVLLSKRGHNKAAVALGGDPGTEKELMMLQNSIRRGRYLRGGRETIVGAKIADALNLEPGDTLKVMTQGADYALHLRKFAVVGIFETGLNMLDDRFFQIPLEDAKKLLRTGGGTQQILIMLKDYRAADEVAGKIAALLGDEDLDVASWSSRGDWAAMVRMAGTIYNYIYFFVAFLGAFIITNIMMMVVLERRKEIGIIKSMGFSRFQVLSLFLAEGTILGLIGSGAGLGIGAVINVFFAVKGLDMTAMMSSFNFPMDNVIYFDISPASFLNVLAIGVVVSAIVSMLPAWRASRMNAVDAIKSV